MTAAQARLIEDNYKIVPYCANYFATFFHMMDADERVSIGHVGLMDAAKTFDPAKGAFTTYAVNAIRLRLMGARASLGHKGRSTPHLELYDAADIQADQSDTELQMDVRQALKDALCGANELDRQCFELHYLGGYTYKEIGKTLGFSGQRARQRAERIASRFRMFWELAHRG